MPDSSRALSKMDPSKVFYHDFYFNFRSAFKMTTASRTEVIKVFSKTAAVNTPLNTTQRLFISILQNYIIT